MVDNPHIHCPSLTINAHSAKITQPCSREDTSMDVDRSYMVVFFFSQTVRSHLHLWSWPRMSSLSMTCRVQGKLLNVQANDPESNWERRMKSNFSLQFFPANNLLLLFIWILAASRPSACPLHWMFTFHQWRVCSTVASVQRSSLHPCSLWILNW